MLLFSLLGVFVAGVMWTGYVQWLIHKAEGTEKLQVTYDVAIVLGAALRDNEPSLALKERLNHALAWYEQGKFSTIIVSGGYDYDEATLTEAEGMKGYLVAQGIPEERILLENKATSTYENLLFSQHMMDEQGFRSAVIITHSYHGARALDISQYLQYEDPVISTTESEVLWMPYHKGRETLAYSKWKLDQWYMKLN